MPELAKLSRLTLIVLGSNQQSVWGNATETVQKASQLVSQMAESAATMSALYATPAFPAGSGPEFVNAAMVIDTTLLPNAVLARLHAIEAQAGRVRYTRWGQRTLDLDLVAVGDIVLPDLQTYGAWRDLSLQDQQQSAPTELILPHPRMQDRAFVLVPLCDVAPQWEHPVLGRTVREMCDSLSPASRSEVVRIAP